MDRSRSVECTLQRVLNRGIGPMEVDMLGTIWEMGETNSRDVFERMRGRRRVGQSTVMTALRRLVDRGVLRRERGEGGVYVYTPAVTREEMGSAMVDQVVDRIYGGDADRVVAYLAGR